MTDGLTYDPQTERYMLGAILVDPGRIWEVRNIVRDTDFAVPMHASIYSAMCNAADAARLPNAIAVTDQLTQEGRAHEVPFEVPHELAGIEGLYGYQAAEFARIVRKFGQRRALAEVAGKIHQIAAAGDDSGGNIVEQAASLLEPLRSGMLRESSLIGGAFDEVVEEMQESVPYHHTPWPSLNASIGGISPGEVYTCAAASGGGKSIFGLQLALHIAESAGRVGYVSLEMDRKDLLKRLISMMTGIEHVAIKNHALDSNGWQAFMQAKTALSVLPLDVFDTAGAGFEDIVSYARYLHRKGDLKLLVIDYHGLIATKSGYQHKTAELNDYAKRFKQLAKELGIAVLLLEQINREAAKRQSPRPIIQDIRGTAALEHDASVVILLHRIQKKIGGRMEYTRDIEFIIAKNRNGPQETRTLYFDGPFMRILQSEYVQTELLEPGVI